MSDMVVYDGRQIPAPVIGGKRYVAMKPIVEGMGLEWNKQLELIKRDAVLSEGMTITGIPSDGGMQSMVCLPFDYLNGWLFKVPANRYKGERREKLIKYQKECYQALSGYFNKGGAINPNADSNQLVALINTIRDQAEENAVLALENRGLRKALKDTAPIQGTYGKISHATLNPRVEFRKSYWRSDRKQRRDDFMIQLRLAIADAMKEID